MMKYSQIDESIFQYIIFHVNEKEEVIWKLIDTW